MPSEIFLKLMIQLIVRTLYLILYWYRILVPLLMNSQYLLTFFFVSNTDCLNNDGYYNDFKNANWVGIIDFLNLVERDNLIKGDVSSYLISISNIYLI